MKRFVTQTDELIHWEEGEAYTLPEDVAHHACDVMRLGPGDELELTDAHQNLVVARIKKDGRVDCQSHTRCATIERRVNVSMVVALFKWPRFEWMLEKLTELGVERIIPVECERSVVRISDWEKKRDRLNKIIVEASRQSLNSKAPELASPLKFKDFVAKSPKSPLYFAHLGEYPTMDKILPNVSGDISFIIGPEGGFSPSEVETLMENGHPISLGPTVLRAETAAIACASSLALWN